MRSRWIAMCFAATMTGCAVFGAKSILLTSPTLPSARGRAWFGVTPNNNTSILLRVKHLSVPDDLAPPASSYVVWVKGIKDAAPQNIGTLKVDAGLSASLLAETPLQNFMLSITAEPSGQAQRPVGQPLLWTNYSR